MVMQATALGAFPLTLLCMNQVQHGVQCRPLGLFSIQAGGAIDPLISEQYAVPSAYNPRPNS